MCALCKLPDRDKYEVLLAAGESVPNARQIVLGDHPEIRLGEGGLQTHSDYLQYIAAPGVFQRGAFLKQTGGVEEQDLLGTPTGELRLKFEKYLWGATLPIVLSAMRAKMVEIEKVTFDDLLSALKLCVEVGQLVFGEPTAREEQVTAGPSLSQIAELISDPEDRKKFINVQRDLQRTLRQTSELAAKYEDKTDGARS